MIVPFREVKVGQIFSEDSTCEILIKVSDTVSQIYDAEQRKVYLCSRSGEPINLEFPADHEVELED